MRHEASQVPSWLIYDAGRKKVNRVAVKIIVVAVAVLVFLAGIVAYWGRQAFGGKPKSAQHLARVDWLPAEATDISFHDQDGLFWRFTYECSIPREAFMLLAE